MYLGQNTQINCSVKVYIVFMKSNYV